MFCHLGHFFFCLGDSVTLRGGALGVHHGGIMLVAAALCCCTVMLYIGEGWRGSNVARSTLHWISGTASATHSQIGPLWCWFPSGWACAHSRPLWVSPTNSPVRPGVSPAATQPPRAFSIRGLRLYFPRTGAPGYAFCFAPRRLSWFICARMWGRGVLPAGLPAPFSATLSPALSAYLHECGATGPASGQTACPFHPTLRQSRSRHGHASPLHPGARLRLSYRSGCLFLFYLLGVGLPCHSIFYQFWLCEEAQCVYLRRHLGSLIFYIFIVVQ